MAEEFSSVSQNYKIANILKVLDSLGISYSTESSINTDLKNHISYDWKNERRNLFNRDMKGQKYGPLYLSYIECIDDYINVQISAKKQNKLEFKSSCTTVLNWQFQISEEETEAFLLYLKKCLH